MTLSGYLFTWCAQEDNIDRGSQFTSRFGSGYMIRWTPNFGSVRLITHGRMVGQRGPISAGPHCSESVGEKQVFGPDIIKDAEEQVKIVRENARVAQSRRKSYAYKRRRDLTFEVNDFVYLKVSPMRGIRRFNIKGKLAPGYIGPFKVLEKKGVVAYKLELPPGLTGVHDKCLRVPEEEAPPEGLDVREDLTYTEHPVKILDTAKRVTRNKRIKMCECGGSITRSGGYLGKRRRDESSLP
ncbi:hypothetical protein U9M48_027716 [Paspalum notatum var. saurae]|uniref:Tf2-1-like SH3-like domain-containing protein n=1 Tax=Paspalum notatum var. saurae TaxID=547442 RepID=A0AAQ3TVD9_PASNO